MTGETVAVKQIQLGNIPKAELGEIMSEIDLLKNLRVSRMILMESMSSANLS
jgi:hypothetical protein